MVKRTKKTSQKKRSFRKPKRKISVLETSFIKWALDRDNKVCLFMDIVAALLLIYGLWFHNLYYIATGIVAMIFGHSYARTKRK